MTLNEHAYYKERMELRCREEGHRRESWHHDGEVRCKWCGVVLESKEYRDAVRRVLSSGEQK